jgi:hypothetical protein
MKRILTSLALAAMCFAVASKAALAEDGAPFKASFAVAFASTPNTGTPPVTYCGGAPLLSVVEAHGDGYSTLGPLGFSLQKTAGGGLFHGCLTLTAANGDTLTATYDATATAPTNANHFTPANGTLTFTGGTGRFSGASGSAHFTAVFAVFYPFLGAPIQGMAFYLVQGTVSVPED